MSERVRVLPLDAANYGRDTLHSEERVWVEKNCYIDIWIEVLHALGLDATAIMPFTMAIDFEGDQWTFFKPPHQELRELYGVDVQELNVWRPLIDHVATHLGEGRMISTEADAFFMPDTSGTDYKTQHTKSTIVINDVDLDARKMGYFHNAGYFELSGDDFVKTFRLDAAPDPTFMPLFAETVRIDRLVKREPRELGTLSRELLRKHLSRRPAKNPVTRFGARFREELPDLQAKGLPHYHAWAFATVRQLGAAAELSAIYVRWLDQALASGENFSAASEDFDKISQSCKAFILKGARAVNSKKPFDAAPTFDEMASAWDRAMETLTSKTRT